MNFANQTLPPSVLDCDVLKSFGKVKSDDGSDVLIELIDLYLRSTPQRLLAIRKAAAENDWVSLKREAHTLKGSSGMLGLHQISKASHDLEQACSNVTADIETGIRSLELKFLEAEPALIAERNRRLEPSRLTSCAQL